MLAELAAGSRPGTEVAQRPPLQPSPAFVA
jgi:hypothetical protein